MLKQTLGSIIAAQPKQSDYDTIAEMVAPALYKGLRTGEYTLTREPKLDNGSPNDNVGLSKVALTTSVSDSGYADVAYEVMSSYKDNNMNPNDYSLAVLRELMRIDESPEGMGLFSDVTLVVGYLVDSETRPVPVRLSVVNSPLENAGTIEATLQFTTLDLEDFTEEYNSDDSERGARSMSYGMSVERFLELDDFE